MTELELYKFVEKNAIEWHWHKNEGKEDVIMFVPTYWIDAFILLVRSATDEDGIECTLKDGYLAFWMRDICEYFGIEMEKVFEEESN